MTTKTTPDTTPLEHLDFDITCMAKPPGWLTCTNSATHMATKKCGHISYLCEQCVNAGLEDSLDPTLSWICMGCGDEDVYGQHLLAMERFR